MKPEPKIHEPHVLAVCESVLVGCSPKVQHEFMRIFGPMSSAFESETLYETALRVLKEHRLALEEKLRLWDGVIKGEATQIPRSRDQAIAMVSIGQRWLQDNTPSPPVSNEEPRVINAEPV